jgi:hypothetical protein
MRLGRRKGQQGNRRNRQMFLKRPGSSLSSRRKIRQSIMRKTARVFAQARFSFSILAALSSARFRSTTRIENSDAVIRVYDDAGNVIETHEHAGEFKEW